MPENLQAPVATAGKYTLSEMGARIRSRMPDQTAVSSFSDEEIGKRAVARKPELQRMIATSAAPQAQPPVRTVPPTTGYTGAGAGIANALTSNPVVKFLGGNAMKFGDTLGTAAAHVTGALGTMNRAATDEAESRRQLAQLLNKPGVSEEQKRHIRNQLGQGQTNVTADVAVPSVMKSNKQVFGEGIGTVLEATQGGRLSGVSAGSGVLGRGAVPLADQSIRQAAFGGLKAGAAYGGAGSLSQAMQENKSGRDIVRSTAFGAAVGAGTGAATSAAFQALLNRFNPQQAAKKAEDINRGVLNQTRKELSVAQRQELAGRGEDVPKMLAEEGIVLGRTADGKLDTTDAIAHVTKKLEGLDDELTTVLDKNKSPMMSLAQARDQFFKEIDAKPGMLHTQKNALKAEVQKVVTDQIRGTSGPDASDAVLTPAQANEFKRALYRYTNYDNPKMDTEIKSLANVVKKQIEDYAKIMRVGDVTGINKRLGSMVVLKKALESAHGKPVRGGMLGNALGRIVGTMAGSTIPVPGVGSIAGYEVGGRIASYMSDPARRSAKAAALMSGNTLGQKAVLPVLKTVNPTLQMFGRASLRKIGEMIGK